MTVSVTLRYFDGCPNWELAKRDLEEAARGLDIDLRVDYEKVESPEEAERLAFRGSPTILVEGRDPFADPNAPVGLSCRVYRNEDGPSGSPGVQALRQVLTAMH